SAGPPDRRDKPGGSPQSIISLSVRGFPVSTKLKPVAVLLFLGACAFGGGSAVVVLGPLLTAAASAQGGAGHGGADLLRTSERFEAVARKVMPAVVAVEAKKPAGAKRPKAEEESGSGVLIRVEGQRGVLVLTNNHVIADAG